MDTPNAEEPSITLPAEMARVIRERVNSGDYGSASELIHEAIRAWLQRERRLAALDAAIANGVAEADSGMGQDIDDVRQEMHERIAAKS
jgi:antitoxin ParD1/3/4